MGGNLKDAVAGGVHDGFAGAHVLFAQFLDDFGAGGRLVAEGGAADLAFKLGDQLARKAIFVHGESLIEPHAGHFPVSGGGVFSRRVRCAFAVSRGGLGGLRQIL